MSKLIKQDITVDSEDNKNSSSSIPSLQKQKQCGILYNNRTNSIDNNDLIIDQMTHLTLFHDNVSNSTNKAGVDKNNAKNDQAVDPDELINLIDDLSVSYKQAPFMPYCL